MLFASTGASCRSWGCMIHFTTQCQHRCAHCYVDFERGNVRDMSDELLDLILAKCAALDLLGNVTLLGGEPFINPERLLDIIRKIWFSGSRLMEVFIPTNGRWVTRTDWEDIGRQLASLGQWFPYNLRVAFSQNEWNLAQLGDLAPLVLERWAELERRCPELFYHRLLTREFLLPLGRAAKNKLSHPDKSVGVNCNFDDWYDPDLNAGFCTDYLSFYPDGSVGLCYVYHSPVIGSAYDNFTDLLRKRRDYLLDLRMLMTGKPFGVLPADACITCKKFYPRWLEEYVGHRSALP